MYACGNATFTHNVDQNVFLFIELDLIIMLLDHITEN